MLTSSVEPEDKALLDLTLSARLYEARRFLVTNIWVPSNSSHDFLTSTKNLFFEVRVMYFSSKKSSKGRTLLDVFFTFEKINVAKFHQAEGRILVRKWDKSLESFPPCFSEAPPPHPPSKSGLKLVCDVNIVHGNLKSENCQDYAQKPQKNGPFMNLASVGSWFASQHGAYCVNCACFSCTLFTILYCIANEGPVIIQYKCLVLIYVFPEMKLCGLVISKTEL
jgi:hypothetical protein